MTASRAPPVRAPERRSSSRTCSPHAECSGHNEIIVILNTVCGIQTTLVRERIVLILALGVLVLGALAAGCGGARTARRRARRSSRPSTRSRSSPSGSTPRADVTNVTPAGAEPHDVELSARDIERVHAADVVLYLGRGFQPGARGRGVRPGRRGGPSPRDGADRRRGGLRPARLARPDALRGAGAKGGRHAGSPGGSRSAGRAARTARPRVPGRARALREARARHEPRRLRLPRACVRPRAGPARGSRAGGGAFRARHRGARPGGRGAAVPRRSSSRRSSPRGSRRRSRARRAPAPPCWIRSKGSRDDEVSAGDDYFSVMRANLAALRKALGCR